MRHEAGATGRCVLDRARGRRGWWSLRPAATALLLAAAWACRPPSLRRAPRRPPSAEFLLAAGDSTFWVTSGPQGVRVRGSPMLLARYGGRFYELYVADEDHSFYDAVFTSQRIYRRDLLTGDSEAVFRDSTVASAARRYARTHPHETPLAPDADAAEDPATSVTGEVDIVDVAGPYLSYEYRGSSSTKSPQMAPDSDADDDADEYDTVRRGVVDLRVARPATLRGVFGAAAADTAAARGRQLYRATLDSVRAARANGDERASRAAAALGEFVFDPGSFSLSDVGGAPAVQFFAHGTGAGEGLILPLAPIPLVAGASAAWWAAEQPTLPVGGADSASDLWTRPGVEVIAHYDTAGAPDEGQGVVLALRRPGTAVRDRVAGDSVGGEWRVGRFPAPTRRIYWLDTPPVDSATRRALVRAFDESALYGDDARTVRLPLSGRRGSRDRVAFAALDNQMIARRSIPARDVRQRGLHRSPRRGATSG